MLDAGDQIGRVTSPGTSVVFFTVIRIPSIGGSL
jgi:hypothetical protein